MAQNILNTTKDLLKKGEFVSTLPAAVKILYNCFFTKSVIWTKSRYDLYP